MVIVLCGPKGVGKTTVRRCLCRMDSQFVPTVGVTTRRKRDGERDGHDYFFVDFDTFRNLKKDGSFLETSDYLSCQYGTVRWILERDINAKRIPVMILDRSGLAQAKIAVPKAFGLPVVSYLLSATEEDLYRRLTTRGESSALLHAERGMLEQIELKEIADFEVQTRKYTPEKIAKRIRDHVIRLQRYVAS